MFSTILPGFAFRGAVEADRNGDTYLVQAKDLIRGIPLEESNTLVKISHTAPGNSGRLQKNDVLLVSRGLKAGSFRSTVFVSDASNVIASSSVHIIRVTDQNVTPKYVSAYLNSKAGQIKLSEIIHGSYIGALPRNKLEKIDVPIPSLQEQAAIVALITNLREQEELIDRKRKIQQGIVSAVFNSLSTHKV